MGLRLFPSHDQGGKDSRGVGLHADKNPRIPRKSGQKAKSDKHSDLYTDEDPRGTIHGLGFTDGAKARQSVNKIKGSGKTHAHKIQAAIAMSQRAKVASQRAKDPQKKKDLGQAHKVYQRYIDTNKKVRIKDGTISKFSNEILAVVTINCISDCWFNN